MPRFITDRSFTFQNHINRELYDSVISNPVILYKLSLTNTQTNLYGESVGGKDYAAGTQLYASIEVEDQQVSQEGFGSDVNQTARFGFNRQHLSNINVYPEIGDIISWDDRYFEIDNVIENTKLGGIETYKFGVLCDTHMTRRSRLNIEEMNRR